MKRKSHWQLPFTIIIMGSLVFTGLTFAMGIHINRNTGEATLVTPLSEEESWSYDMMDIVWGEFWRYWALAGYWSTMAVFTYCWFEWKRESGYWSSEEELRGRKT